MQDKIGKQNFHGDMKKVYKTVTKFIKDVSGNITKTIAETSNNNNIAIENFNSQLLEIMIDRFISILFDVSSTKTTNPENTSQFKLVKDPNSNRVIDLIIHNSIPITLQDNLLTFRDSNKKMELKGELLKI